MNQAWLIIGILIKDQGIRLRIKPAMEITGPLTELLGAQQPYLFFNIIVYHQIAYM